MVIYNLNEGVGTAEQAKSNLAVEGFCHVRPHMQTITESRDLVGLLSQVPPLPGGGLQFLKHKKQQSTLSHSVQFVEIGPHMQTNHY